MSLRDTLKAAASEAAEAARFEADKPRIIAEWQSNVKAFNAQIEVWLGDYLQDGSISISETTEIYREDSLGAYEIQWITIKAAHYIVLVKPVGRMIFGAMGRIDMFRQGQGDSNAVRFLHMKNGEQILWFIRRSQVVRFGNAGVMARPSEVEILTKENFEAALDEILK